jgi:hypothetical protein
MVFVVELVEHCERMTLGDHMRDLEMAEMAFENVDFENNLGAVSMLGEDRATLAKVFEKVECLQDLILALPLAVGGSVKLARASQNTWCFGVSLVILALAEEGSAKSAKAFEKLEDNEDQCVTLLTLAAEVLVKTARVSEKLVNLDG